MKGIHSQEGESLSSANILRTRRDFRCRCLHFLVQKTSKFMMCPHGQWERKLSQCPYVIGGSCTDEITFSDLWHDRETKARLVHAFYRSSRVDLITKNGVSKKRKKDMRRGCTPVSAKISKIFLRFIVLSPKKRSSPLDCTP